MKPNQCSSCGGFCKKSGCERENVKPKPQRTLVGLTGEEIDQGLLRSNHALQTAGAWRNGVEWATKQLKEKNTR